jgi:hypothetical protein
LGLEKPGPPAKSAPTVTVTRDQLNIDRNDPAWPKYREMVERQAQKHNEDLTAQQLNTRADLEQVLAAARAGQLDDLSRAQKVAVLDEFDRLAKQSGMRQSWINAKRGNSLSESLFLPQSQRGLAKTAWLNGTDVTKVPVPKGGDGRTIPTTLTRGRISPSGST